MKALLLFIVGITSLVSFAQDGSLDTSFGDFGSVVVDYQEENNFSTTVIEQSDGKVITGGFSYINSTEENSLFRYNIDGTIDTSFGDNGILITPVVGNLNFQENDKLIVSGATDNITGNLSLIRYLSNGTIDNSFATNGVLNTDLPAGHLYKINLLNDDSILLTGAINDSNMFSVVFQKYLPNGALDISFGNNGTIINEIGPSSYTIQKVAESSNNIYMLAKRQSDTDFEFIVIKFTENFIVDNNYGINGISTFDFGEMPQFSSNVATFGILNDDSIYIAGGYGGCQNSFEAFHAKLKPNGEKDNSFGNNGIRALSSNFYFPKQVIIQENNRVLIAGNVSDCFEWSFATISRYFSDGFEDNSFNFQDDGQEIFFDDMQILADGKIIMVGTTPWYTGDFGSDFGIVR
jgi:uncharacterized delta-60 repeat protein